MKNIDISQIIGLIALIILICSIQSNKKKNVLFLQIFSNAFFGLHYAILNSISAAAMNFIAIIRGIIYYCYSNKNQRAPSEVLIILFVVIVVVSLITSTGIISILPIIATLLYTYGIWQDNLKRYRRIVIVGATLWLIFNLYVGAHVAMISSIFELTSGIIAIYRYDIRKQKKNIS